MYCLTAVGGDGDGMERKTELVLQPDMLDRTVHVPARNRSRLTSFRVLIKNGKEAAERQLFGLLWTLRSKDTNLYLGKTIELGDLFSPATEIWRFSVKNIYDKCLRYCIEIDV